MPLNDPKPDFKVTPSFDADYKRNGKRYRHIITMEYNRVLHTLYSTVSFRMTLSDHEWLSKIFNDTKHARSVCDSWASCYCTVCLLLRCKRPSGPFGFSSLKWQDECAAPFVWNQHDHLTVIAIKFSAKYKSRFTIISKLCGQCNDLWNHISCCYSV